MLRVFVPWLLLVGCAKRGPPAPVEPATSVVSGRSAPDAAPRMVEIACDRFAVAVSGMQFVEPERLLIERGGRLSLLDLRTLESTPLPRPPELEQLIHVHGDNAFVVRHRGPHATLGHLDWRTGAFTPFELRHDLSMASMEFHEGLVSYTQLDGDTLRHGVVDGVAGKELWSTTEMSTDVPLRISQDGRRIGTFDKAWDARTGEALPGATVPPYIPDRPEHAAPVFARSPFDGRVVTVTDDACVLLLLSGGR